MGLFDNYQERYGCDISNDKERLIEFRELSDHFMNCFTDKGVEAFEDPETIEILGNGNNGICDVYQERLGSGMTPLMRLPATRVHSFMNALSSFYLRELNAKTPILECEFPFQPGSRFSGLIPPIVVGPTFSLRKAASLVFTLDDYVEQGILKQQQKEIICQGIRKRKNILVVGGTGSGKTTLINALLDFATKDNPETRFVIMQDTSEIQCNAANKVLLHTTLSISLSTLLKTTLRLRPDRIIVGEVRDGAALDMLDAWNTGHPGGFATIHANSASEALIRLEGLITRNENKPDDIRDIIGMAVDYIIFITKTEGYGRYVQEIIELEGLKDDQYQFKYL